MDKTFEDITSATYMGISLACTRVEVHYPPDKIVSGATGDRTLVVNHEPGTVVAHLVLNSGGMVELTKRMLATKGRALKGTLEIVSEGATYSFEDACMLHGPDDHGRCELNVER